MRRGVRLKRKGSRLIFKSGDVVIMLHFFAFRPPGMLLGEICIPFPAITLHSNALILLHDYQ